MQQEQSVPDQRILLKRENCAGVAHNKILAKLASGMHKPMQQTVVPSSATATLLHDLPIPKLRQLGGKFGEEIMSSLSITTVGQTCLCFSDSDLHLFLVPPPPLFALLHACRSLSCTHACLARPRKPHPGAAQSGAQGCSSINFWLFEW